MGVDIDIVYQGDLRCRAQHRPSGSTLGSEAPVDNGGTGSDFSPTDLVATALGTCAMTILGLVARRTGLDLAGTRLHVLKEMVSEPVRRIGALHVSVTIPAGRVPDPADRRRLEAGARTCPVLQSLHPDVRAEIDFTYEA
jgi:putative redox protein